MSESSVASPRTFRRALSALIVAALVLNGSMAAAMAAEDPFPEVSASGSATADPAAEDPGASATADPDGPDPAQTGESLAPEEANGLGQGEASVDANPSPSDPSPGEASPGADTAASQPEGETPSAADEASGAVESGAVADEPTELPAPALAALAAAPQEDVPDVTVVPTPEDVTFYWPDFGVAAVDGVYGIQFRDDATATWTTMTTDTQPLTDNIPEDVQNADQWVTVFDVQPDETYTARIVSAPTAQDIFDTTEDADPVASPGPVTLSQPLPFTIERYIQSTGNPPLAAKCGLDFGLVLDSSGSIGNAISSLKTAANGFVDALVDTGSQVSQVSFATRSPGSGGTNIGPIALTSANLATIKSSYANLRTNDGNNNRTNWQDGLLKSQQRFTFPPPGPGTTPGAPDLVIVITDGNPNTIGSGQSVREGSPAAVDPAIRIANEMKAAGAHVFVVAVGRNISEAPIKAISGTEKLNADGSNFATAGYTTTRDYASLALTLREIAVNLCAPSLTITKQAQRPGSTDFLPADGWTFETSVRLNGGSGAWVNPGTDAIPADTFSPKSQVTANGGAANFQWKPSGAFTSDVRIREITQPGFTRQEFLQCNARNALTGDRRDFVVGPLDGDTWDFTKVANGVLGFREIVTCTAKNNLDFANLTVVKDAAGSPQDFGFTGAITQAVATPDARFPNTFTLDDDASSATPKQQSWDQLSPGTYVITEDALPAGWRLDDITITGAQLTKDLANRTATIVLAPGDDATVTFSNRSGSTLTVTKAFAKPAGLTIPDGFTFTIPVDCSDDAFDQDVVFSKADIDAGNLTRTISGVPLGTVCSFDETLPLTTIDGWTWGAPTFTPTSKSVTIAADPTQNVATVTNTIFRPALTLVKVADKTSVATVGETIKYTFTARNTGNVTLTAVSITDPLPGLSALACTPNAPAVLAPGGQLECTATYQVTQADLNTGGVSNTATATGTPPTGPPLTPTSTVTVPGTRTPALTLVKTADKTSVATVGETIGYTFTATNTGNQTLTGVSITDPLPGLSALACTPNAPAVLAPGGQLECTATYQVTQADLNTGGVSNTATATGTPPTGPPLTPTSTVTVPGTRTPGLTLVKTADKTQIAAVGETIGYTFTATNTGNTTLTAAGISDPLPGLSALSCAPNQPAVLAPTEQLVCTASYVVTQADLNAGAVSNTATATGTPPTGPPLTPTSTVSVPGTQTPGLTLVKTADKTQIAAVGETIGYTFTATNTGNQTLTAVAVSDPLPNLSALSCNPVQPATLAPGEQVVCTASYVVTQADLDAGAVFNTATATGTPPTGPPLTPTSTVAVPATQTPGLTLVKVADKASVSTLGETIKYTFTATNTGNQTLTGVSITDPLAGLSALSCTPTQPAVLAPGGQLVCTATYQVTQADLNTGGVSNTATATGTPPGGVPLTPTSTVTVPATQTPGKKPPATIPPLSPLPKTGGPSWVGPLVPIAILLMFAGGLMVRLGSQRTKGRTGVEARSVA